MQFFCHTRLARGGKVSAADGFTDLFHLLQAVADGFARDAVVIAIGAGVSVAPQFYRLFAA